MNKRVVATKAIAVPALIAVVLSGCGGEGKTPDKTGDNVSKLPPASAGPQEITMYTAGGAITEDAFNDMYGNAIRKKFPNVTLSYIQNTKGAALADLIAAGTTIDIVFDSIAYSNTFRNFGIHMDMMPYIKEKKLDLNQFEQTAIEYQRKVGGGSAIYSLPVWTATAGLFYNKDLFDKFGVAYPTDHMTWAQVYDLAKRLTRNEGGIQYYGYVTSPASQANTNQLGLKYFDAKTGKARLDTDEWTKFMNSIAQFYQISGMNWTKDNITVAATRAMFEKDRTVAMYTNYSGGTPPETMNWDVVQVPYYDEAPGIGPQTYPAYLSLTSLSKNKSLAFDVISFLVSEEYQLENTRAGRATVLNRPDILKQYGAGMDKFKGKNVSAMFPAKRAPIGDYSPEDTIVSAKFGTAFNEIILEKKDVNTALREANEAANKEIETLQQTK